MIEVKDLVKRYGDHLAVDHISFTVEDGKIYGFLGPNGAGKSTTMNIMTGYLGATSGSVSICGHDILEEPEEAKRCIGYLPELPPLYPDMTVLEYLTFVAELKKVPKGDRLTQIDDAMELAHVDQVSHRLIKNLSKGYRQRVGLAQALLGFPEILILDEPTVGLDPTQIIEIRDLIKKLAVNHTVILSSHILSEVQAVCDHILIIDHGHLIASGTPDELEEKLNGGNRMDLNVKGTEEQVRAILEAQTGLSHITLAPAGDGTLNLSFTMDGAEDIREKLFYAFAEARCPILTMQKTATSLEQVFLKMIAEDETAPAPAEETADYAPAVTLEAEAMHIAADAAATDKEGGAE